MNTNRGAEKGFILGSLAAKTDMPERIFMLCRVPFRLVVFAQSAV